MTRRRWILLAILLVLLLVHEAAMAVFLYDCGRYDCGGLQSAAVAVQFALIVAAAAVLVSGLWRSWRR